MEDRGWMPWEWRGLQFRRRKSGWVFVSGIELGDRNVEDFQVFRHGAVAAAGLDEDGRSRAEGMNGAVEFDMALAFEDVVEFGHALVVVQLAVALDLHQVHGGDGVRIVHESPPRQPAGTGAGGDVGQSGQLEA